MHKHDQTILKITDACNLNCSYCYFYAHGQHPVETRSVMSIENVKSFAQTARRHCEDEGIDEYSIVLHGGEPLLPGLDYITKVVEICENLLMPVTSIKWAIQTNGTLLSDEMCKYLVKKDFLIGVSIDGDQKSHDRYRVDINGAGSYHAAIEGIERLISHGATCGVLCTASAEDDGAAVFRSLVSLGVPHLNLLLADYTYDDCPFELDWLNDATFRYFSEAFDAWLEEDNPNIHVQFFESAVRVSLGGAPTICTMSKTCPNFISFSPDGQISSCDVLGSTGVFGKAPLAADFSNLMEKSDHMAIQSESFLPETCQKCDYLSRCGGHCPTTRFSSERQFDNVSIYCNFFKRFFDHVEDRLNRAGR